MKLARVLVVVLPILPLVLGDMYYSNVPHLRPQAKFEAKDTLRLNCAATNCTMPLHAPVNGSNRQRSGWKRPVTREHSLVEMPKRLKLSRSESPPLGNNDD